MTLLKDSVVENANNPGTSTINLAGAAPGPFVTFATRFASGAQVFYGISDESSQREIGIGTFTTGSPNTLSRDTVLSNTSGTTSKLNFTGVVFVYNPLPAGYAVQLDGTGNLSANYDISSPTQNGGPLAGTRNRLTNSAFQINQRGFISGNSLSAGVYGHDRWKAGASGCTYSFTGSPFGTLTITAGSLQQVIEAGASQGSNTHTLSWSGTATATVDGGSFVSSPATFTSLAGGTAHTIEFGTGTVIRPQFETGLISSQWEIRLPAIEQLLCDRFCSAGNFSFCSYGVASGLPFMLIQLPTQMRAVPSLTLNVSTNTNCGTNTLTALDDRNLRLGTAVGSTNPFSLIGSYLATAEL